MSHHLHETRKTLTTRRDEIAPYVSEHAELEEILSALGEAPKPAAKRGRPKAAATTPKAKAPKAAKADGQPARGRKKGSGKRGQQALEIITGQPGISIPEMAQAMDIKQNYLYRVLPGLVEDGKIVKDGKGWRPVGDTVETPQAETPEVPVETAAEAEERKAAEDAAQEPASDPEPAGDLEPETTSEAALEPETF